MSKIIAFYKPYGIISQFSGDDPAKTLSAFNLPKEVYPAGRLDKDSEGLLILSDNGDFIHRLTDPKFEKKKFYYAQVEKVPTEEDLAKLRTGVKIKDYTTKAAHVRALELDIEERDPPIRFRKNIPTCWLELIISEGKNRQVRRMTAAIGFPTLRLIRFQVGKYKLAGLKPGEFKEISVQDIL